MIDISKQYRTRDGREVKLLMTDGGGQSPIIGAILGLGDAPVWTATRWYPDGSWHYSREESPVDLIEVKPRIKREAWVNVYSTYMGGAHGSKESADKAVGSEARIACVKIEIDCEVGEGL